MKKILGIDLGVASVGYALIEEGDEGRIIRAMGVRSIPLSKDDSDEFNKGNAISRNQVRTQARTLRKGYDRYQQRRGHLAAELSAHGMLPGESLMKLDSISLYGLRARAVDEKVEPDEIGRILLHLNQKRGYRSSKADAAGDARQTAYVQEVRGRFAQLQESGLTIGQHFFLQLQSHPFFRIKELVFPREAYLQEFDAIVENQRQYYPGLLTSEFVHRLRNEIIYYQRRLKSQKGLVGICELEGFRVNDAKGKSVFVGPRVAPRSSPLFQLSKIWETIHAITLKNKYGVVLEISLEQKLRIAEGLNGKERLSQADLFKILGLQKNDGWLGNKQTVKGLQGNVTRSAIAGVLKDYPEFEHLLTFELAVNESGEEARLPNPNTDEVISSTKHKVIDGSFERQPFYRLWHTIYSISDEQECARALQASFGLPPEAAASLSRLDFVKSGFSSKSAKAIRKTLPYLMEGFMYSDAVVLARYKYPGASTKEDRVSRPIAERLELLQKNSLRQPVVEKILNQLIHVVNGVVERYGAFGKDDEIRIELARELKQSKDERNDTYVALSKRERKNAAIAQELNSKGVKVSRRSVMKMHLFEEIGDKLNATCIYCGQLFGISDALNGNAVEIEHIIPRSLYFDNSQGNTTLAHRKCNADKGNRTAFDFVSSRGDAALAEYVERVDALHKSGVISKGKRDKLLLPGEKIPRDFIERQLRETQYIARKAKTILEQICPTVWTTTGSITSFLRRIWGWDEVLKNLMLPAYREMGLTDWIEVGGENGGLQKKEIIRDWTKRDDHRHHAVDALTIACTRQTFIQRINTLSAKSTRDKMFNEVGKDAYGSSLLEKYVLHHRPFTTAEVENAVSQVLISFKPGKKVATAGVRKVKRGGKKHTVQTGILSPRGPISEESVYGKIRVLDANLDTGEPIRHPLKYLFEHPGLIFKPYIRELVERRLADYDGDIRSALASLKKDPIFLDDARTKALSYASCFVEEVVIKYPLTSIKAKDVKFIIDKKVRSIVQERIDKYGEKDAFRDLENSPVWFNEEKMIPLKTVRCFTKLTAVEPVKKDESGRVIGFVKPGNNHHMAIYQNADGSKVPHVCSFWHAVERKRAGIPVVVMNPGSVWLRVLSDRQMYPDAFLSKLPADGLQFVMSFQQNEMYLLDYPGEIENADTSTLSQYLYRVQKMSVKGSGAMNIWFRHHLETQLNDSPGAKRAKRFYDIASIGALEKLNPRKVVVSLIGEVKSAH